MSPQGNYQLSTIALTFIVHRNHTFTANNKMALICDHFYLIIKKPLKEFHRITFKWLYKGINTISYRVCSVAIWIADKFSLIQDEKQITLR